MKIQNTKDLKEVPYIDAIVYGAAKIGKTRFASTFPKPFFITFKQEGGIDSLRGLDVNYVEVDSVAGFAEAIKLINTELKNSKSKVKIGTVVIDSLTSLYELIEDDFSVGVDSKGKRIKRNISWDMRGAINDQVLYFFNGLKSLKDRYKVNVVFIAHATEKQDEEVTLRRIGIGSFGLSTTLAKNVNYVLYMTVSGEERIIRLKADSKSQAGTRSVPGVEVPDSLDGDDSMNYESLLEALGFKKSE